MEFTRRKIRDPILIIAMAQFFTTGIYLSFFPYFSIYLQKLGFSTSYITTLITMEGSARVVGLLVGGVCADFRYPFFFTFLGFFITSLSYFLLSFSSCVSLYPLCFCLIGFFYGFAYPCESNLIVKLEKKRDFKKVYALIKTAMMFAAIIAPVIGIFVLKQPTMITFFAGIFFFIYAFIILIFFPAIDSVTTQKQSTFYSEVLNDKLFVKLIGCLLILSICSAMVYTSLPIYLEKFFEDGASIYTTIFFVNRWLVVLSQIFIVKVFEKFKDINVIFSSIFLYCLVFLLLSIFGNSPSLTIILFALFTVVELVVMPNAYGLIMQFAAKENSGKYQAFANLRYFLARPISAFLGGIFIPYGYFYYVAYFLFSFFSIPFFLLVKKDFFKLK